MIVYNIRRAKYATLLKASGITNRWNKNDEFVLYTSGSVSLSTLELIAHRSHINTKNEYKLLYIHLDINPDDITEISVDDLPQNWRSIEAYPALQSIGSDWYFIKRSLVLKVPSALIPQEFNYVINTYHPDFDSKVIIQKTEDFEWDKRLL